MYNSNVLLKSEPFEIRMFPWPPKIMETICRTDPRFLLVEDLCYTWSETTFCLADFTIAWFYKLQKKVAKKCTKNDISSEPKIMAGYDQFGRKSCSGYVLPLLHWVLTLINDGF